MMKFYAKLLNIFILIIVLTDYNFGITSISDSTNSPPNSFSNIPALNFKDTDVRDILRGIALEYKTNIFVDNKITQKVSIALFDISVFDAIKMISTDNNFEFGYDSQRFFVKLKKEIPPPPYIEPEPVITYYPNSNKLDVVLENVDIQKFVDKLRVKTNKNFLLTSGTSGKLQGKLHNVNFSSGLKNLLLNNGYYLIEKDSIYYVSRSTYFSSLEKDSKNGGFPYWVSAQNGKITIDINNADLGKVLDDLAKQLNLQLIKLASPNSKITVKCSEVSLEFGLYYLFKGTEFTYKHENDTYIIGKKDSKNLDNVKLVKLKHVRADKVHENMPKELFPQVISSISIEHNGLILTGPNESIHSMVDYIKSIDQPVPQVMIEALVVDYNLDDLFELGLELGRGDSSKLMQQDKWFPGIDATAGGERINKFLTDIASLNVFGLDLNVGNLGKLPGNFFANIKMLEENGVANIKSRPLLSTLNGHTASLKIGTTQNYIFNEIMPVTNQLSSTFLERESLQKIEAFISFEITPWVGPNNQLTLDIKPDFQTPSGEFSPDKNKIPSINTRTLESTVRLKDGETIVLGGLIQETESTTISKVPLLGDIPLLGELFKSTSKQTGKAELMIYLTPHIFYGDEFGVDYIEYGMN